MENSIGNGTPPTPSSGPAVQQNRSPTQASGPPLQSQMQPSGSNLQTNPSPTHASAFSQPTRQSPTHPSGSAMPTGQTSMQPSGSAMPTGQTSMQPSGSTLQTRQSPTHASGFTQQTKQGFRALEDACGRSEHIVLYEERAAARLVKSSEIVDKHIEQILSNVGLRIQKDISAFIKESFNALVEVNSNKLNEAMEPIIAYMEDDLVVLHKSLHPQNFRKVLQLLWNTVCEGLHDNAISWEMGNTEDQITMFKRVLQIIPYLQTYFEGGDAGLTMADMNTPQYKDMHHLFNHFSISTEELILTYYHERAQFHINFKGKTKFGTLRVRIGYWNEKLSVEVISATGLTPHDEELTFLKYFYKKEPTSDAMIELQLKPDSYFSNEETNATAVKWKNLNPVFEENFYWSITREDCQRSSAVLVLTAKHYELLSKNAFLGEAIVPLHVIPGISNSPEPQPMTLMLHEVDKEDHSLLVLKSRKWDDTAKDFADNQLGRFVQAVAH